MKKALIVVLGWFLATVWAEGATRVPPRHWRVWHRGVNARQVHEQTRIAQGMLSGSLTVAEARHLEGIERSIAQMEAAMRSDGVLTVSERQQLQAALNVASQAIYTAKHDGSARPVVRPSLVQWVNSGNATGAEARELLAQLHRMSEILRLLGGAPLPPAARHALEQEYAQLASQVFE